MRDFLYETTIFAIMGMLLVMTVILCAAGTNALFVAYQCDSFARVTGKRTEYAALTCYIEQDGRMMEYAEYKLRYERNLTINAGE